MARASTRISGPQEQRWVDPSLDPATARAEIDAVLAESAEYPVIDFPPDDLVTLPGGLLIENKLIKTATVKELTGEDEEALARASQSMNPFHFIDRLLRCGVIRIGDEPEGSTEELLKELLVGDREHLILGIRRATYGEEIELENWKCPLCASEATLSMQLDDIPTSDLENPREEISFEVPLKKGGKVEVRLANGADQVALFEKENLTQAERETILLSRCITTLTGSDGIDRNMAAFPSLARSLGMVDRHKILKELRDRQPGPKYDQVEYTCEACGEGVKVAVGLGDLFLDFRWI